MIIYLFGMTMPMQTENAPFIRLFTEEPTADDVVKAFYDGLQKADSPDEVNAAALAKLRSLWTDAIVTEGLQYLAQHKAKAVLGSLFGNVQPFIQRHVLE